MNVAERFGDNLRRCRKLADLSQEEVGRRAGMNRTQVAAAERGERLPRIDTLMKLAGALEVSPDELLEGIRWQPGSKIEGRFFESEVPGLGTVHRRFEVERHGTGS